MKLLCCVSCNQVFSLAYEYQECRGGHGGGQYIDNVNARIWGPGNRIFILGFANSTFISALRAQLEQGDSTEMFDYAGEYTPKGRDFTAFVIPDAASSVVREDTRFDPIVPRY